MFVVVVVVVVASDWEEGRRCVLMSKEKPLSNIKHGRLYMTQRQVTVEVGLCLGVSGLGLKATFTYFKLFPKLYCILSVSGLARGTST